MLQIPPPAERYSAEVHLELNTGNRVFPLAKSGPGYAILREPESICVGNADLVMTIDGRKYLWKVQLTCEATPIDGRVEFRIVSGPQSELPQPQVQQARQLILFAEHPH